MFLEMFTFVIVNNELAVNIGVNHPRRACAGGLRYLSCLSVYTVCPSVCYHLIVDILRFYGVSKVRTALL